MEENELSFDNILTDEETASSLFEEQNDTSPEEGKEKDTNETTDVNPDTIFSEDSQESVSGEDEDIQETEGPNSKKNKSGSSPNFYSSLTTALKEDGVLPDLEDEDLAKVQSPEDFASVIEKQIEARLEDVQKRVKEALDYGIEPSEIKSYETTISYLDGLTDDAIEDETDAGENLRKSLIFQDFINRGFSEARAKRETEKSINGGTDIEDAKEALMSNRDFFKKGYTTLIKTAREEVENENKLQKQQTEEFRKKSLETEAPFEGVKLDKRVRQSIYDTATKAVAKSDDGQMLTAIQKYEKENPIDFRYKLATIFTLTDGFKNLDGLVQGKVKKETSKSLRELEHTLRGNSTLGNGSLKLANGFGEDANSSSGLKLDVN